VVRLGAAVADEHGRWVALRDPVGMPFCVTPVPPA
jgi:hypothetical protein